MRAMNAFQNPYYISNATNNITSKSQFNERCPSDNFCSLNYVIEGAVICSLNRDLSAMPLTNTE